MTVIAGRVGELYAEYAADVFSTALRITGCQTAAEDVVHDIFLQLHVGPAVRPIGCCRQWFQGAAIKRSLMHLRATRRRHEVGIEPYIEYLENPGNPGIIDAIALDRAIVQLSDALRVVFVLHEVEGMTHTEIGERLGISPAASAKRLSRAVESLRIQLGGP